MCACVFYMCIYREQCLSYFTEGWNNLSGTVFPRVLYLFICGFFSFLGLVCVLYVQLKYSVSRFDLPAAGSVRLPVRQARYLKNSLVFVCVGDLKMLHLPEFTP